MTVELQPVVIRGHYQIAASTATTLTASATIVAANADRRYLSIQNDDDTVAYLGIGEDAVLNAGHRLNASGAEFILSGAAGNLDTRSVSVISSAAGKKLIIKEA